MQSLATAKYGGKHVAHGKVIVIVGMEVKMGMRIAFHHLAHELDDLQRVQYAQRVRQHDSGGYWSAPRRPSDANTYSGECFHAVAPVFQIDIHYHILLVGVIHYGQNILDMLFGSLLQLVGAMLQRAFAQQIDDTATGRMYPVHRRVAVYKAQHFHPVAADHGRGAPSGKCIRTASTSPFGYPGRSHLHAVQRSGPAAAHGLSSASHGARKETPLVCSPSRERRVHDFYSGMFHIVVFIV